MHLKILNLYAGIGGNRKLWGNEHDITAVEIDPNIAKIYQDFFPKDKVIVADAHKYLLEHYQEFDFIWSSPPCPTHSDIRRCGVHGGKHKAKYPDMKLYEEIIFLKHFSKCPYVVENVVSFYTPLIEPYKVERHFFWSNKIITNANLKDNRKHQTIIGTRPVYGYDIKKYDGVDRRMLLRNLVNPELGLHVFNCIFKKKQGTLL